MKGPAGRSPASAGLSSPMLAGAFLVGIAVLAYLPTLRAGFVWDDDTFLTDNPLIKAADGLRRFWCSTEPPDYWPVTSTTLWVEWRLWGLHAIGYHATNLALHAIESLGWWRVLRRLSFPGAYLAALLFAVHPVNVESVAWIAERKNLMAMLFYLLSIHWFIGVERVVPNALNDAAGRTSALGTTRSTYWLSLAAFILAMLSKGSVAMLPAVLLGLILWRRRPDYRDLLRLTPFFLVGAGLAGVNVWFQHHHMLGSIRNAGPGERLLGAGAVVEFYLGKALAPFRLIFFYPQWRIRPDNPLWWLPLLTAIAAAAVFWRFRRSWGRPWLFAWSYFCLALLPAMGLTDVYFMKYSLVADHYQHLAIIAVLGMVAAGWARWRAAAGPSARGPVLAAAAVVLGLAGLTWRQCLNYRDAGTLYAATLRSNPGAWFAENNWGLLLCHAGNAAEAERHFATALRLNPACAEAHSNLGLLLADSGRNLEAIPHLEEAVRLNEHSLKAHDDLAGVLAAVPERRDEAIAEYESILRVEPERAAAHSNVGYLMSAIPGRLPEAISHCELAVRLAPSLPEAQCNLGCVLARAGRAAAGIANLNEALRLRSDFPEAHYNLGNALAASGRYQEAVGHYEAAVRLRPNYADAHNNLGNALSKLPGRLPEAVDHYRAALRCGQASVAQVHVNLGRALLGIPGKRQEAEEEFEEALRIQPGLPGIQRFLERLRVAPPAGPSLSLNPAVGPSPRE